MLADGAMASGLLRLLHDLDRAVIVAVVAVGVVQSAVYEVIDMVTVRHGLVTAAGSVAVLRLVAVLGRLALGRVLVAHLEHVLLDLAVGRVVQMAVVEVVHVVLVLDGGVSAVGAVLVRVLAVGALMSHRWVPFAVLRGDSGVDEV